MADTLQPGDIMLEALNWENFKVTLFGFNIIKLVSFKISYKADYSFQKDRSGENSTYMVKGYEREAEATIQLGELKKFISLSPGGDVLKLPPAPVTMECEVENQFLTLTVPAVKIQEFDIDLKVGDDKTEVPLKFAMLSYPILAVA